jgi:NIPSNAP protein
MTAYELRIYEAATGKMALLKDALRELAVPLMAEYGMRIAGLWSTTDDRVLYWVVEHHGTGDVDANWHGFHEDPRWTKNLAERTKGVSFVAGTQSIPLTGVAGFPPQAR